MNKKLPSGLVTAIALLAAGASAHGADLGVAYPRMPVVPDWTGFYLGANLGGAFAQEKP
jgi:outer membrane immunogenic protein